MQQGGQQQQQQEDDGSGGDGDSPSRRSSAASSQPPPKRRESSQQQQPEAGEKDRLLRQEDADKLNRESVAVTSPVIEDNKRMEEKFGRQSVKFFFKISVYTSKQPQSTCILMSFRTRHPRDCWTL